MEVAGREPAVLDTVVELLTREASPAAARKLGTFARRYLHRVPDAELSRRTPENWAGLVRSQFRFVTERGLGEAAQVRIFNPTMESDGWETSHTVIEILCDDRPFLVDSTTLAISEFDASIHLIIHPVFQVQRDAGGFLMQLGGGEELDGAAAESVMHFEIDRVTERRVLDELQARIETALEDVRLAVRDWEQILARLDEAIGALEDADTPYQEEEVAETVAFLRWLADDHFTFLGYREYRVVPEEGREVLDAQRDSGLGILAQSIPGTKTAVLSRDPREIALSGPVIITKTKGRSTVHRGGYMDYIGVMDFDAEGRLVGERRFLGLYTSSAYNRRPWNIPYVRRKVDAVMNASGLTPASHGGKALLHIMETLPRDELFQANPDELFDLAIGIFDLQERQKTRLFIRRDRFGRFFSCLVFIPRDRFKTETRERIQAILKRSLSGDSVDFTVQVSESKLARVHVTIRTRPNMAPDYAVDEIEQRLVEAVRTWGDRLREILVEKHGEDTGLAWARRYGASFPAAYVEDVTPWVASFDVENLAALGGDDDLRMSLYRPRQRDANVFRFKIFRRNRTIPLSDALPILENMGLRIVSERPYRLEAKDGACWWIQDFDMQLDGGGDIDLDQLRDPFEEGFRRVVHGEAEDDGFNRLVIAAGLDWRQVAMLRGYCKYLLQTGVPFSQQYMEESLATHPGIVRTLVGYFQALFDPRRDEETANQAETRNRSLVRAIEEYSEDTLDAQAFDLLKALGAAGDRKAQVRASERLLRHQIERVRSLDEDRILRGFFSVMRATLRTNYYQEGAPYLAFKIRSEGLPDLPQPRPWREIFVYSPRVEGIHLRGGAVARGGLRWSDRREDFRTEVLGLMKAQMVKNTLIVPVGAKGGFVVKRLPVDGTRDALMAEVVACYRFFINALLDVTDNVRDDTIVPPPSLVRRDDDDPYLVVAADKGTATFSDIANSVSENHGFWLGDAFASGGSAGYDHKGMGITARGAWESVKRHFRELGMDCQSEPFTVVGIGDMSGDVFGNGMLLSRQIRLQAAFNHLHIFIDPDPDPESSFVERERLFRLDRSAWTDYDQKLISRGGGIYKRSAKEIELTPEVKAWLGLEVAAVTPQELVRELLRAPVDLLWNGGIGTYVKASSETNAEVGDRGNDGLRMDGRDVRARVIGEGGNLGLTQRGRIEYAMAGGRINTDALDNSAGVDCSDHEVNIKILLNPPMRDGTLALEARNELLAAMTDEVAELVLRNNYLQAQAVSMMERLSVDRIGSKAHLIDVLEAQGELDRELETLPTRDDISERRKRGQGLARPELCTLMAYAKMTVYTALLDSGVPEDPYLSRELQRYFPGPLQRDYATYMDDHPLRREIIATMVTNSLVNRMGATFALRMHEDTGARTSEIAKAYSVAREIFNARDWWDAIEAHDNQVPSEIQLEVQLDIWHLLRHQTRWILHHHRNDLDIAALVDRYRDGVGELRDGVATWCGEAWKARVDERRSALEHAGFAAPLAARLATARALIPALDILEVSLDADAAVERVACLYFAVEDAFKLGWLMREIEGLHVDGQWHAHARGGLRDELYINHRQLTARVLRADRGTAGAGEAVAQWMGEIEEQLAFFDAMMRDMRNAGAMDYATASVAMRALDQLVMNL
ncbi:MAG: NAD-glutamate dehydrogenase [Pseudomonadota bacterium]